MNGCCYLSNAFSASNGMNMWIVFEFVSIVDYIDGFSCIEPSLHAWGEAYLIVVNDAFDVFLSSVCENFVEFYFFT